MNGIYGHFNFTLHDNTVIRDNIIWQFKRLHYSFGSHERPFSCVVPAKSVQIIFQVEIIRNIWKANLMWNFLNLQKVKNVFDFYISWDYVKNKPFFLNVLVLNDVSKRLIRSCRKSLMKLSSFNSLSTTTDFKTITSFWNTLHMFCCSLNHCSSASASCWRFKSITLS